MSEIDFGIGGADSYFADSIALPGEFIQSGNNFLKDSIGKSVEDLLSNAGINVEELFSKFSGAGSGVPDVDSEFDASDGYVLGGVVGGTGAAAGALAWAGVGSTTTGASVAAAIHAAAEAGTVEGISAVVASPALTGFAGVAMGAAS